MPAYIASDVMNDSAAALNDFNRTLYSYAVQLPYLKMALRDLDQKLQLIEHPVTLIDEAIIPVLANATELTLPASFFLPIKLQEKASADPEYTDMFQRTFVDDETITKTSTLRWWDYRHNCINFIGATVDRTVKLFYWRTMPELVDETSNILVNGARNYLAFRTAFYCASFIAKNQLTMKATIELANEAWSTMEGVFIKNNQSKRVRRLAFNGVRTR